MVAEIADQRHFARAVTELGEKRPVVARSPIFNTQGLKIIDKGVAIDARLYERLTQHQLRTPLDECLDSEPSIDGRRLRAEAQLLCADDRFCAAMAAQLRDPGMLFDELALLPLPRPVAFQLTVMSEVQPVLWQHSLRSMVYAAWLALRLGGARFDARMLAAGGLLHDLGMLHLDSVLGRPAEALQREQRRALYTHPLLAVMVMERHHVYPRELLQAVLEHHEALDGSGYPRNLGAEMSPWGRLLSLTEVVSSLTASPGGAPALRLSLALRMNARRFDVEAMKVVTGWLRPLAEPPPGLAPAADPRRDLRRADELLQRWHAAAAPAGGTALDPARGRAVRLIGELCDAQRRSLADSGVAPGQLAMLGDEAEDPALLSELALIARESAWQMRTAARQARRRWRLAKGETFPPPLQAWLDEVDAYCAAVMAQ
ncbi:MAG: HD domain-containing protein [Rubrivivax sp.]|nr:HD domain-containing protein [Rubrivivax sp.]